MSTLQFDTTEGLILIIGNDDNVLGSWNAANNVDSHSNGPWPPGEYAFGFYQPHPGDGPDSAFGSHGIFIFNVPNREGMGVHSGRESIPDGLGREGYEHCTLGCIRTTDDATAQILRTHSVNPISAISVR